MGGKIGQIYLDECGWDLDRHDNKMLSWHMQLLLTRVTVSVLRTVNIFAYKFISLTRSSHELGDGVERLKRDPANGYFGQYLCQIHGGLYMTKHV